MAIRKSERDRASVCVGEMNVGVCLSSMRHVETLHAWNAQAKFVSVPPQLPEYMQNLKDQLQEELKSTTNDRRAILEAELLRLHEDRRRALTEKDKERDGRLRRELDRLASSSYSGSLSLKQRFVYDPASASSETTSLVHAFSHDISSSLYIHMILLLLYSRERQQEI